ncbi:N-acetyltransferase [Pseudonocardiaceae bacterium YIM PH 21723]|nr:N-acetyltransferase [Pseudonocardiaceae bacterium YIM PH 21723]
MTATLRPLTERDLDWMIATMQDRDQVGDHVWTGFVSGRRMRKRFAEHGYLSEDLGRFVVEADGAPVGWVTWYRNQHGPNDLGRCLGIGGMVLTDHRGRGYGATAQRMLADYLFAHTTVHRVEADTLLDNIAEQRCLEKAGFQREAVIREGWFLNGQWRDCVLYARLRTDS